VKKLIVTVNYGNRPQAPIEVDETWEKIAYTDCPEIYDSSWTIRGLGYPVVVPDKIQSKQVKWLFPKWFMGYDIVVYVDCNIAVRNLDEYLAKNPIRKDIALIRHRSSKSISDEIELCKHNNRWDEDCQQWEMCQDPYMIHKKRNMYANGIMLYKPGYKLSWYAELVSKTIPMCNRDQVLWPYVNDQELVKVQGLEWDTFNNNTFNIQYP